MGKSLRFGLALFAMVIVTSGCLSTGAGKKTEAAKIPGQADAEQRKGGPDAGAGGTGVASGAAKRESSWIVMPLVSSNPKLGTVYGLGAGLIYHFDEQSNASKFSVSAQHTTTDSTIGALSAKTSFGKDLHRLNLTLKGGRINNDYEDYLGTGIALKSVDESYALNGSYIYRLSGNLLVGPQMVFSNYRVVGQTPSDDETLESLGVVGVKSGGIGASIQYDTRDNDNSPTRGWFANLNNMAYREWLGSDEDYDVYRLDMRAFWGHGHGHVLGVRQNNTWTSGAPLTAQASPNVRGYKAGEYLGENVSSVEVEERVHLAKRWGATLFAGVACLYGGGESCSDDENLYPSYGVGIQFIYRPKDGIVGNLEYARGKGDNEGIYMKGGYYF